MNFVSWTLQMAVKNSMVSVYETSFTYLTLDSIIGCNLEDVIRFFFQSNTKLLQLFFHTSFSVIHFILNKIKLIKFRLICYQNLLITCWGVLQYILQDSISDITTQKGHTIEMWYTVQLGSAILVYMIVVSIDVWSRSSYATKLASSTLREDIVIIYQSF